MTQLSDLIQQYSKGASIEGIKNLETLFDILKRDRDRAEAITRAWQSQVEVLAKRLSVLENGEKPERPPRQQRDTQTTDAQTPNAQTSKAKVSAEPKQPKGAIEVEF